MNYLKGLFSKNIFKYLVAMSIITSAFLFFVSCAFTDISPDQSDLPNVEKTHGGSGGRINGLGISSNGQIAFAASEWGGIFKSYDAGLTWDHLSSHVPVATWDVEISPTDQDKVYVSSFFDGKIDSLSGISVSSDGGATWINPPTATPSEEFCSAVIYQQNKSYTGKFANSIVNLSGNPWPEGNFGAMGIYINPDNTNEVYIGTWCGLAISKDAGSTWEFEDPFVFPENLENYDAANASGGVLHQPAAIWDVLVHNNGIVDVCGADGHFRRLSGSNTWSNNTQSGFGLPGGRCSIAVSPHEPDVLFASVGRSIYQSIDGGAFWFGFNEPSTTPQGRIPFVETNERDANSFDLWYGDKQLYARSCTTPDALDIDSLGNFRCWGIPWINHQKGAHWDVGALVFNPTQTTNACPVLFSNDGGVFYNTLTSSDTCHDPVWDEPDITPHALWLMGMSGFKKPGDGEDLYFGSQDVGIFETNNADSDKPDWRNSSGADAFDIIGDSEKVLRIRGSFNPGPQWRIQFKDPQGVDLSFPSTAGSYGGGPGNGSWLKTSNYPPFGDLIGFMPQDTIAQYGPNSYALLTTANLNITPDITVDPVQWISLGNPGAGCGLKVSKDIKTLEFADNILIGNNIPILIDQYSFFIQTTPEMSSNGCWGHSIDSIWRFDGTDPNIGAWSQIHPPGDQMIKKGVYVAEPGYGGFSLYDVDPNNPNRIIASQIIPISKIGNVIKYMDQMLNLLQTQYASIPENPSTNFINQILSKRLAEFETRMVMTEDGGLTWKLLPDLDAKMSGDGQFKPYTGLGGPTKFSEFAPGYFQSSLLEFDPYDDDIIIAGAADAGVFVSTDSGEKWTLLTDPYTPSDAHPHIPRPRFAHFEHDVEGFSEEAINVYIGTQGRGVWKLTALVDFEIRIASTETASPGDDITKKVKLVLKNAGAAKTQNVDITVYLSADDRISDRDLVLDSISLKNNPNMIPLAAGEQHNYSKLLNNIKIPSKLRSGNYYICASVDERNEVSEYNEDNNSSCSPIEIGSSKSSR